jgi:predicted nucleic-acid-binding protein
MIGLDTNILLRYLLEDDLLQAELASNLIRKIGEEDGTCFLNNIVLCELVWVLETGYHYDKKIIISVLEKVISARQFVFENQAILWRALHEYRKNRADFSDQLISQINLTQGCEYTLTFDKKAGKSSGFAHLGPANK